MKRVPSVLLITSWILWLAMPVAVSQEKADAFNPEAERALRILFYNLENAYDTIDDPFAGDDEFTAHGVRAWTPYRYRQKLEHLYKAIQSAGGWKPPEIIGVCETENRRVLEDLTKSTPLSRYPYRIIHQDSPDPRGIDVALLYHDQHFKPLYHRFIPVRFAGSKASTRDILYVKGVALACDTLHMFVNHWPSKWQGEIQTQPKRKRAARTLRRLIDSLQAIDSHPRIIITGDFNDSPDAVCLREYLGARPMPAKPYTPRTLYNLSFPWKSQPTGTHKYRASWGILDQMIVSGSLLTGEGLYTTFGDAHIYQPAFLLEEDSRYTGSKPYRSYSGYRYIGGFSDHLPVILDLKKDARRP